MPQFSVIMPAYNRGDMIDRSIRSVFDQTCDDWELIVADDGSTDDTRQRAAAWGDRVRVVACKQVGPGGARNAAMAVATGRYAAFLDSDDLWFPWMLQTAAEAIDRFDGPSLMMGAIQPFHGVEPPPTPPRGPTEFEHSRDYFACTRHAELGPTSTCVVDLDRARAAGGFLEGLINYEDVHLWMKLGDAPGFIFVRSPVVCAYRMHPGSITRDMQRKYAGLAHCLSTERGGGYPGGAERRRDRSRILARFVRSAADQCTRSGAVGLGLRLYRASLGDQIAQRRWKFVFGFPAQAAVHAVRRPGAG